MEPLGTHARLEEAQAPAAIAAADALLVDCVLDVFDLFECSECRYENTTDKKINVENTGNFRTSQTLRVVWRRGQADLASGQGVGGTLGPASRQLCGLGGAVCPLVLLNSPECKPPLASVKPKDLRKHSKSVHRLRAIIYVDTSQRNKSPTAALAILAVDREAFFDAVRFQPSIEPARVVKPL